MANGRLIRRFTLDSSNKTIRATTATEGLTNLHLAEGSYYMSDDGSVVAGSVDFITVFVALLEIAFPTSTGWTVDIYGVGTSSSSVAEGRLKIVSGLEAITFHFSDSLNTFDPRILGFPAGADTASATTHISDHVHRYGWYPQTNAAQWTPYSVPNSTVDFTTGGYLDGVDWGETDTIEALFDNVGSPLVRTGAANISGVASIWNLTTGDVNSSWERFAVDAARDFEPWRHYNDTTDSSTFDGPYVFSQSSGLWTDPLAAPSFFETDNAEHWTIAIQGRGFVE